MVRQVVLMKLIGSIEGDLVSEQQCLSVALAVALSLYLDAEFGVQSFGNSLSFTDTACAVCVHWL